MPERVMFFFKAYDIHSMPAGQWLPPLDIHSHPDHVQLMSLGLHLKSSVILGISKV